MQQYLRRAGGSLVMTIPKAFVEQNHLADGSAVELMLNGETMLISAPKAKKYQLDDLLAEMQAIMLDGELPMVEGWDALPAVGKEQV